MSWSTLWLAVLASAFASFTVVSLAVAVKGLAEVRELFASLQGEAQDGARKPEP